MPRALTDPQLRATPVDVNVVSGGGGGAGGLTNTELRATPVPVSGTFWQATQPVSGTFWQATQPISAVSLPLPTNAATDRSTAAAPFSVRLSDGAAFISTLPVSIASTVAVSAVSLPLPTNAATDAKQDTGNESLSSINSKVTACNTAAVSGPTAEGATPSTNPVLVGGVDSTGALYALPLTSRLFLDEPRDMAVPVRSRRLEEALDTVIAQNSTIIQLLTNIASYLDPMTPAAAFQSQGTQAVLVGEVTSPVPWDPNTTIQ